MKKKKCLRLDGKQDEVDCAGSSSPGSVSKEQSGETLPQDIPSTGIFYKFKITLMDFMNIGWIACNYSIDQTYS